MKSICLVLSLCLTLCLFSGCSGNKETANQEVSSQTQSENAEIDTAPKMDINNPITELHSVEYSNGNDTVSYKVPQINCDSYDALVINAEIVKEYSNKIIDELINMNEEVSVILNTIKWELVKNNDNTFALIISHYYPDSSCAYMVYNFDAKTGKRITNEEIIKKAKLNDEEFIKKAKSAAEKCYRDKYGDFAGEENPMFKEMLEYTISDERITTDMPMFINQNQGISIIASIGSLAGATSYYNIVEL